MDGSVRRHSATLTRVRLAALTGACLLALLPATLLAQSVDDDAPPRFQFGPLGLTPRVSLKDVGVDTNPLNQAVAPERSVTATLVPGVDSWLRIGRARLSAKTSVEWLYFSRSSTQRSFNLNQEARAELALNRVTPFVAGGYLRTRQRPNLEVDLRVQQHTTTGGAGTGIRLGTRLRFEVEGRRSSLEFADGKYGNQAIAEALDRDSDLVGLSTRITLTPLTTFVVRTESVRDRFRLSPIRDSDSVSVLPGFEFKPSALIAGKVSVGYRQFTALDARVPDFGGVVGQIDAQYTLRQATRFAFKADRNIEYSIEDTQPYFVANGGSVQVTQVVGLNWYVIGRGGRTRLVYRNFVTGISDRSAGRSDRVDTSGFGIGRRLGDDLRVGFDVNHSRRVSTVKARQYDGFRLGVSISYGS